jgi:hypothetical protein
MNVTIKAELTVIWSDSDFFWLGRVPCRNVRLVGMVVGVQVFEKRVIYSSTYGLFKMCSLVLDLIWAHSRRWYSSYRLRAPTHSRCYHANQKQTNYQQASG